MQGYGLEFVSNWQTVRNCYTTPPVAIACIHMLYMPCGLAYSEDATYETEVSYM